MPLNEQHEENFSTLQETASFTPDISPDIRMFLENLLKDGGLTLSEEVQEEMIKELFIQLDQFLTHRIVDALSYEDCEVFIAMVDQGRSMVEVQKFIYSHIPNAREVFANAFIAFRELYLGTKKEKDLSQPHKDRIMSPQEKIVELLKIYTPNIRREFRYIYQKSLL